MSSTKMTGHSRDHSVVDPPVHQPSLGDASEIVEGTARLSKRRQGTAITLDKIGQQFKSLQQSELGSHYIGQRGKSDSIQGQGSRVNLTSPVGILAIHLKQVTLIRADYKKDLNIYAMYQIGDHMKTTSVYENILPPTVLVFDELKHFHMCLNNKGSAPENHVKIELVMYDTIAPRIHRVLGRNYFHLYDLLRRLYISERLEVRREDKLAGYMDIEFCFSYGHLGYGYSNQLEHPTLSAKDQIAHSMFCYVEPPEDRKNEDGHDSHVMTCLPVGHPAFINFTERVDLSYAAHDYKSDVNLNAAELKITANPTNLIQKMQKHMHALQSEMEHKQSRKERLQFLTQLVQQESFVHDYEFKVTQDFCLRHRNLKFVKRANSSDEGEEISHEDSYEEIPSGLPESEGAKPSTSVHSETVKRRSGFHPKNVLKSLWETITKLTFGRKNIKTPTVYSPVNKDEEFDESEENSVTSPPEDSTQEDLKSLVKSRIIDSLSHFHTQRTSITPRRSADVVKASTSDSKKKRMSIAAKFMAHRKAKVFDRDTEDTEDDEYTRSGRTFFKSRRPDDELEKSARNDDQQSSSSKKDSSSALPKVVVTPLDKKKQKR